MYIFLLLVFDFSLTDQEQILRIMTFALNTAKIRIITELGSQAYVGRRQQNLPWQYDIELGLVVHDKTCLLSWYGIELTIVT